MVLAVYPLCGPAEPVRADDKTGQSLTLGLYAPEATFASSAEALAYITKLAQAVEERTGLRTTGKAFLRHGDLERAQVDFAVISGRCLSGVKGNILAAAAIEGKTVETWGLFASSQGTTLALRGARLAYVKTECRDKEFLEYAMLGGELSLEFFGALVDKPNVTGSVAAVASYRSADAVFAPLRQGQGLHKVFEAGTIPTPAFVQANGTLSDAIVTQVTSAVVAFRVTGGGFSEWRPASREHWSWFSAALRPRPKEPMLAAPEVTRLWVVDALRFVPPAALETATDQHFIVPRRTRDTRR
jgi:hypothetical protein